MSICSNEFLQLAAYFGGGTLFDQENQYVTMTRVRYEQCYSIIDGAGMYIYNSNRDFVLDQLYFNSTISGEKYTLKTFVFPL
jgi:hypothetical protein